MYAPHHPFPRSRPSRPGHSPILKPASVINGWSMALAMILEGWGATMQNDARNDPRRPARLKGPDDLAERLQGLIESRACGRIRDLHVVCADGQIILQGR